MEALVTPLFVATHQGTKPGFAPPGWVDKVDFPKGISLGRGHLLPNSVGGDGGRPGNLMTLEQHKVNSGQFGQNENDLRAALKGGWNVSYSVEPTYADIPVDLGKAEGIKRIPDPIPRTINVSGQIVGRRRPLSPFVEQHVNFRIPALSKRADFGITNPVIDNFISGADYNADPFRQDMARRFREQGR